MAKGGLTPTLNGQKMWGKWCSAWKAWGNLLWESLKIRRSQDPTCPFQAPPSSSSTSVNWHFFVSRNRMVKGFLATCSDHVGLCIWKLQTAVKQLGGLPMLRPPKMLLHATRSGDVAWCSWVANEDTLKSLSTKIYWDLHGFTIQLTSWPCEENSLGAWVRRFCPGIPPGGNVLPADLAAGPHKTLGKAQFSDVIAGDPVSGLSFYDKKP